MKKKIIKAWAIVNNDWKNWGWNNPLQQLPFSKRGDDTIVFPLAIFETLKEAKWFYKEWFYKDGDRKEIKIKKIEIKI